MEQKAKNAAREVKSEVTDSWLTAKTKIALYADERVKSRQISVETVKGTVMLRSKVEWSRSRAPRPASRSARGRSSRRSRCR